MVVANAAGIKAAICTALRTVTTLRRVYDQLPENINETPCAYVLPKSGQFHKDAGGNMIHNFEVTVFVRRIGDIAQGQEDLDEYLDATGTICAAIESASLSTYAHDLYVSGYRDYGGFEYPQGSGYVYIGVKFDVVVLA